MGEMEPMVNTVLKYPMVDTDRLNNPALTAKPEIPGNSEKKPENDTVAAEPEVKANTGGGGGGAPVNQTTGSGGSGIVIIRNHREEAA